MRLKITLALALIVVLMVSHQVSALEYAGIIRTNAEHTYAIWNSKSKLLAIGLYWKSVLVGKYYSKVAIISANGSVVWVSEKIKGFIHPLWSSDGRLLVLKIDESFENYDIAVYDVSKEKIIGKFSAKPYENLGSVSLSPEGNQITFPIHDMIRENARIVSYDPEFSRKIWESKRIGNTSITWISWSPKSNYIAALALAFYSKTFTIAGKVIMFDNNGRILWEKELFKIAPEEPHVLIAKWNCRGNLLAILFVTSKTAEVRIYDNDGVLRGRYVIASNIGNVLHVSAMLDWNPSDTLSSAISYSYNNKALSKIVVIDTQSDLLWNTTFPNSSITHMSWNPFGNLLATVMLNSERETVKIFNIRGQMVQEHSVSGYYVSWLSNELLMVSGLNNVVFYSLKGKEKIFEIKLEEFEEKSKQVYPQLYIAVLLLIFALAFSAVIFRRRKAISSMKP